MDKQQPVYVAGQKPMESLGVALDAASFDWMVEQYPDIAAAIEQSLARGATPGQVKRFVLAHTGRLELALRCEQCARAALRAKEG
jgi:hypothetical protein